MQASGWKAAEQVAAVVSGTSRALAPRSFVPAILATHTHLDLFYATQSTQLSKIVPLSPPMLCLLLRLRAIDCRLVQTTVLTTSSTVHPLDKSFTGIRNPCMIGPTADADACCTALYALLPALRSGKMQTVAFPATGLSPSLYLTFATAGSTACVEREGESEW